MQSRANIITSRWKVCFRKTIFSKFNTNLLDRALYFYKLVLVTDPFYHFGGIYILHLHFTTLQSSELFKNEQNQICPGYNSIIITIK